MRANDDMAYGGSQASRRQNSSSDNGSDPDAQESASFEALIGPQISAAADIHAVRPPATHLRLKRGFDVVVTGVGLIVVAPLIAVVSLIIKLTSSGPVFFRQQRMGANGVLFEVLKFRTMRDGTHAEVLADQEQLERYRQNDFKLCNDDPRITRVGRFLRKTSLDELPQLLNVLRGEMSLVGIRPLLEIEVGLRSPYDQECYKLMKPGMTGLWQVEGRSHISHDDRYTLDRRYVEEWSLLGDLKLLARTPVAVLRTDATR